MRNHFSRRGRGACAMLLLLAASGWVTSCQDEYKLDDEKPAWLGESVYDYLEQEGKFTNYLRLLVDPDINVSEDADNYVSYVDILKEKGSRTVFVADDESWDNFFAHNATLPESDPWHTATSYENLSASQKKLILHTSMLNNAIVMENLASDKGTTSSLGFEPPRRGQYVRRNTDVGVTDSITYLPGDALPISYNPDEQGEHDYWWRFRSENGGNGLYIVSDASASMMLHFTGEYLANNNITDEDFSVFMGRERTPSDVHIYDALLVDKDQVCQNGYVNRTEKLMRPLPNMAEMLRTNGQTYIFSHMLDRWAMPFYSEDVTEAYKKVMLAKGIEWTDSIFVKRYLSDRSYGGVPLATYPNGQSISGEALSLRFDPGWNAYYDEKGNPQLDMASMFVPTDPTLWKYFTEGGGGWQLIKTYCDPTVTYSNIENPTAEDYEKLYRNIDLIPMETLFQLIRNVMFKSFVLSVPSKMLSLPNDAQEQMFFPEDVEATKHALLANNGVIYLTDKVYGPADYTSVAAPANISTENKVMKWAINNGSTATATDYMHLNYYAYLKAMQSRFAFFLPSDDALKYYYETVSFRSNKKRVLQMENKKKENFTGFPITYKAYRYDPETGLIGTEYKGENITSDELVNRLKDILESHTIVLDGREEIDSDVDEYYITKNGSAVRVIRENGKIVKVQGGFQLENEAAGITNSDRGTLVCNTTEPGQTMANGTTYLLDAPIIPSARSVWNVLTNNDNIEGSIYEEFYQLCDHTKKQEILEQCGLVDKRLTKAKQNIALKKFQIFTADDKGPDYNVQFFNNYRYTVFVPTNEAVQNAISEGLPTWEQINDDYEATLKARLTRIDELTALIKNRETPADQLPLLRQEQSDLQALAGVDSLRLQAKITYLTNFIRYHFADNSVFVDYSDINEADYVTASYDSEKGLFCKVIIDRHNRAMRLKDQSGRDSWIDVVGQYNVMARDIACNKTPNKAVTMNGITIDGSSFAVIHQVSDVLKHDDKPYASHWETPEAARRYIKRFAIQ